MKFIPADIPGIIEIIMEPQRDERGHFLRTWCVEEFRAQGLETNFVQHSSSFNVRAGTLRGMHYQRPPFSETKIIRCTRGHAFDVLLDLRPDSGTFLSWRSFDLSPENFNAIYAPPGVAHGFQTLEDNTELAYQITPAYSAPHAFGVRWNDPAFSIQWPYTCDRTVSEKDEQWEDFSLDRLGERCS